MASRWVDNGSYFGPDRRRRSGKRLFDRRRHDEAVEPPSLSALLRRLRVRVNGPTPDDRRHALDMVQAAIAEANRLGWPRCAAALAGVDEALRADASDDAIAAAEALVAQALEHAAAGR